MVPIKERCEARIEQRIEKTVHLKMSIETARVLQRIIGHMYGHSATIKIFDALHDAGISSDKSLTLKQHKTNWIKIIKK